jgi:hypothetical protein
MSLTSFGSHASSATLEAPVSLSSRLGWWQFHSEWFRIYWVRMTSYTSSAQLRAYDAYLVVVDGRTHAQISRVYQKNQHGPAGGTRAQPLAWAH